MLSFITVTGVVAIVTQVLPQDHKVVIAVFYSGKLTAKIFLEVVVCKILKKSMADLISLMILKLLPKALKPVVITLILGL